MRDDILILLAVLDAWAGRQCDLTAEEWARGEALMEADTEEQESEAA